MTEERYDTPRMHEIRSSEIARAREAQVFGLV